MVHEFELEGQRGPPFIYEVRAGVGSGAGGWRILCFSCSSPLPGSAQKQDDSQFTVEARFYQKLDKQEDQVQAVPARMHGGRSRARLLRRAREPRRDYYSLVHSRVCGRARRSHREEAPVPLPAGGRSPSRWPLPDATSTASSADWDISQSRPEQVPAEFTPPRRVAELAKQYGCPTIAYTYSEPVSSASF